jgi:uncharacterized protein YbcI
MTTESSGVQTASSGSGEVGGELLTRISNEMVHAQKKFFGNRPTSAKSYMLDDMLLIVMRGGFTTAEQTMLEFGQQDLVRQFRQIFENEMTDRLQTMIEDLTGRKVLTYQSQILFEPDVVVEIFLFDSEGGKGTIEATARGLLEDDDSGEATNGGNEKPDDTGRGAD